MSKLLKLLNVETVKNVGTDDIIELVKRWKLVKLLREFFQGVGSHYFFYIHFLWGGRLPDPMNLNFDLILL